MKINTVIGLLILLCLRNIGNTAELKGELKQWHTLTLSFEGDFTSEYDTLNPFLNYRLEATFTNGTTQITVPGYFAADGNAAESSARAGKIWKVKFVPNKTGEWRYQVSFRQGKNIAISIDKEAGRAVSFDGDSGSFVIAGSDKKGRDFRAKGRLIAGDNHYPRFEGSGEIFLKGGTNSPEDLLAYYEFDGTKQKHRYASHGKEWKAGDVTWQGGKGKNLIGSLNYLSSKGINSVYFLTMNVMGDGKNVWPWTESHERYRFDVSKLAQWDLVFSHMDKIGLVQHAITQETENENLLDIGYVGIQRKLYYRELIARFGHHLGIVWNMGEENGITHWSPVGQTNKMRVKMIEYFDAQEAYGNLVVIHTLPDLNDHKNTLTPLLGNPALDGISFQVHHLHDAYQVIKSWTGQSAKAGKPWIAWLDEIGPADTGAWDDSRPGQQDTVRKKVIWATLMAGGAGVEHYFGYKQKHSDLSSEDWHVRDRLWELTNHAVKFFEKLPVAQMTPSNDLVNNKEVKCLARQESIYIVYMPNAMDNVTIRLDGTSKYTVLWFDPIKGKGGLKGSIRSFRGAGTTSIGDPPAGYQDQDWAVVIEKK